MQVRIGKNTKIWIYKQRNLPIILDIITEKTFLENFCLHFLYSCVY